MMMTKVITLVRAVLLRSARNNYMGMLHTF